MIHFQSFDVSEAEKINEFLIKYPLSTQMNICFSNGKVLIPFEDGKEDTVAVKKVKLQDLILGLKRNIDTIVISQEVMLLEIKGATEQLNSLKDKITIIGGTKKKYSENKAIEKEISRLESFIRSKEDNIKMNQVELTRLDTNVIAHEGLIAQLDK